MDQENIENDIENDSQAEEKATLDSVSETQVTIDESDRNAIPLTEFDSSTTDGSRVNITGDLEDDPDQSMFFSGSETPLRIDYVIVYNAEDIGSETEKQRQTFEENLSDVGVILEHENSGDGKLGCVKIHSPWEALMKGAKLLGMRKKIKVNMDTTTAFDACSCLKSLAPDQSIVPDEADFFTAPFDPSNLETFEIDDREEFFTNAERSLITKLFLDSTECPIEEKEGHHHISKGVDCLIHRKVYSAAYPLHEGSIKHLTKDPDFFEGKDKDRLRLYYSWAKPSNAFRFQPLDYIRKYFGEKIGLYFAWLGLYTVLLIPATVFGLGVFLYGLITLPTDAPSNDVCNITGPGSYIICPLCDNLCDFQRLNVSCVYARLTHVFDNYATVALAIFMAAWALSFLEFWKREQAALQFMWDIRDYEAYEKLRPGYEKNARKFKVNPVTEKPEPYIPWFEKFLRLFTSLSMIVFLIAVVCVAIFSVLVYRLAVAAALFAARMEGAKLITTVTASVINLLLITILGFVYKWVALFATKLEKHKTFSDHEDSYTFKIIVFQFINYYGSILYIAFFKGSFIDPPGVKNMYVFGKYRQDECDPTGCFIELTIQLAIIMIGKQAINGFVEIILPAVLNCFRRLHDNPIHRKRWEDDFDLQENSAFLFFDEYLEMVIQFGFVTIFVAAFPLAPLFALINNVIEIRLDAYKAIKMFRRPTAIRAQDIGAWYPILRGFAYIAVVTNAFIIAWTSEFIPKLVYIWNNNNSTDGGSLVGYIDSSLATANASLLSHTNDYKSVIYEDSHNYGSQNLTSHNLTSQNLTSHNLKYPECRFRGFVKLNENYQYEPTKEYWQILFARMAFVIVFEHLCFLVMSMISILVPDVSARIKRMMRYEREVQQRMAYEESFTDVRDKRVSMYFRASRLYGDNGLK